MRELQLLLHILFLHGSYYVSELCNAPFTQECLQNTRCLSALSSSSYVLSFGSSIIARAFSDNATVLEPRG